MYIVPLLKSVISGPTCVSIYKTYEKKYESDDFGVQCLAVRVSPVDRPKWSQNNGLNNELIIVHNLNGSVNGMSVIQIVTLNTPSLSPVRYP